MEIRTAPEVMTYDSDGNLASDSMWNYTWDAENRLASMQLKSAANLPILQIVFAYDHLGRRIRKASQTMLQIADYRTCQHIDFEPIKAPHWGR